MKQLIAYSLISCVSWTTWAQLYTETIHKEFSFEKVSDVNALLIFNINGNVTVVGHSGSNIIVDVEKRVMAKTQERLEKGKQELQLGTLDRSDTILLFIKGVCSPFGKSSRKDSWRSRHNGWGYQWDDCNQREDCEESYDYTMHFTVKIPQAANLVASTINEGDIFVENVKGFVGAENINGSIDLRNIAGTTHATTINGDVDLSYVNNPPQDSRYYSLNGDVKANFKKGLAADLSFKSFNGDLFTNIENLEALPVSLEKKQTSKGVKYKIGGTRYRVGKGGIHLDFETFNGNVYVKEL
jgi:hypothetical protein